MPFLRRRSEEADHRLNPEVEMKQAVLRVTGTSRNMVARVCSGRKGTGKVLGSCSANPSVWSGPLFRLAEKVALECRVKVLVETFTFPGGYDNCCVVPVLEGTHCIHLPNRYF
jgi:hypothetical protein